MALIPEPSITIQGMIDDYHASQTEPFRPHMGASQLGNECERYIWLSFRWAVKEQISGRVKRIFRRGNNEEATVVSDLRNIGLDVQSTGANQSRVLLGGHVSGSVDGIIRSGVPEASKTPHILEIKTTNQKGYDALVKDGVKKAKFQHFVQMQVYMHGMKLTRALYVAINKNDDSMYTERVEYDKVIAEMYINKGHFLSFQEEMPRKLSEDKTFFICKMCGMNDFCHGSKMTKEVNCRTCANSTPTEDGTWFCERWNDAIPKDVAYTGCDSHVIRPDMMPYEFRPADKDWHAIYIIKGKPVLNGGDGFKSSEIIANPEACSDNDIFMNELRTTMGAEVIG
jgi:hypothetical protein